MLGDEFTIRLEEAKSWFVLAQILMILAGFLFATAGISYNNAENSIKNIYNINSRLLPDMISMYSSLSTVNKDSSQDINELLSMYGENMNKIIDLQNNMTLRNNRRYHNSMFSASAIVFLSLIFFLIGKKRIKSLNYVVSIQK